MRLLGRILAAAFLPALLGFLFLLVRAGSTAMLSDSRAPGPWSGGAQPSLAYALEREPSTFVFSRPQQRVRILSNVELAGGAMNPLYGFRVEALVEDGERFWSRDIHVRSVPLDVRRDDGKLVPHAFIRESGAGRLSAGDVTLIDFGRPASAVLLSAVIREPGARRMLVRIQEQRPLSERQQEVGWDRLSPRERNLLSAGNPLGPALLSDDERRNLLVSRWNPVGPAGVEGRDYRRTLIYERPGPVVPVTSRASR